MQTTVDSAEFKRALKKLSFVESTNLVLNFELGYIQAADNEMQVLTKYKDLVSENGKVLLVPAKQISSVVSNLSGRILLSHKEGQTLIIESQKSRFELPLASGNLPQKATPPKKLIPVDFKTLQPALKFASSILDRNKYDFSGAVLVTPNHVVATDKSRMAVVPVKLDFECLIPLRSVLAVCDLSGNVLNVGVTDNAVFLESDNTMIITRKMLDKFPDWQAIMPKSFGIEAFMDVKEVKDSLNRVAPMTKGSTSSAVVEIKGEGLILKTGNTAEGKASDEIEIEITKPDPMLEDVEVSFRVEHSFLSEFFYEAKDRVFVGIVDSKSPILLEHGNFKMLIATIV